MTDDGSNECLQFRFLTDLSFLCFRFWLASSVLDYDGWWIRAMTAFPICVESTWQTAESHMSLMSGLQIFLGEIVLQMEVVEFQYHEGNWSLYPWQASVHTSCPMPLPVKGPWHQDLLTVCLSFSISLSLSLSLSLQLQISWNCCLVHSNGNSLTAKLWQKITGTQCLKVLTVSEDIAWTMVLEKRGIGNWIVQGDEEKP